MQIISDVEWAKAMMHYVLGSPELRQPYINVTAMNGTYKLQMFPLGYEGFEEMGFAFRVADNKRVVYYRYGNGWKEFERGFALQFMGDNS